MEETVFTALGRNPDPDPLGRTGFAGVGWKQSGVRYSAWLDIPKNLTWPAFLPRVIEWAIQASEDLRRRDRENFFATYFRSSGEILIAGLPLKRTYSEQSPLDDIPAEAFGEPSPQSPEIPAAFRDPSG